eukprot:TRINITY_DN17455_c0_g1_i1.p1 TRINITY_DN17455_c0_g1~~TRINITY_DN17455_c0_g1_i1.p1  ORF type:complete len:204 (-),score=31.43 TRINITY_DN17455_c0_g1_i1:90-701(-)
MDSRQDAITAEQNDPDLGFLKGLPLVVKELLAGGIAGGFAKTAVAPLERIKILFQTRQREFQSLGVLNSLKKILRTEGIVGLYRGNGASVARIVPYAALHYMTYEEYRRWILFYCPGLGTSPMIDLVAGSFAGGTAVLCTYPLDLARTQLAYQLPGSYHASLHGHANQCVHLRKNYKGILDVFQSVYKEGGFRALYRGIGMNH